MPAITLYDITVPVWIGNIQALLAIIQKAKSYADEKGIPYSQLTEAKLYPDMANFIYQIQRISDTSKGVVVRVAGVEPVKMEDNETTFEELEARLQKTIKFMEGVDPKSMEGVEEKTVELKLQSGTLTMSAKDHVLKMGIPNFYFHLVTAYDILRHMGVPIGKMDFMGRA